MGWREKTVSMCVSENWEKSKRTSDSGRCVVVRLCATSTPCLLTVFSVSCSTCVPQSPPTHSLKTKALWLRSVGAAVTAASLPLHCLDLFVSDNIWFWWASWLHWYSGVCVCAPESVFLFDFLLLFHLCGCPLGETIEVRHMRLTHGKHEPRQLASWRRHEEEMNKRLRIISVQHDGWVNLFLIYMWFVSSLLKMLQRERKTVNDKDLF